MNGSCVFSCHGGKSVFLVVMIEVDKLTLAGSKAGGFVGLNVELLSKASKQIVHWDSAGSWDLYIV